MNVQKTNLALTYNKEKNRRERVENTPDVRGSLCRSRESYRLAIAGSQPNNLRNRFMN